MGGNKRFRTATYVDSQGNRHTVKDRNGNNIEIPEQIGVSRRKRTNTTAANARERMLNARAVQEVRGLAKEIRQINKELGNSASTDWNKVNKALDNYKQLGALANQIQPGAVSSNPNGLYTSSEIKTMEKLLGVKLT